MVLYTVLHIQHLDIDAHHLHDLLHNNADHILYMGPNT